ncbi:MAG: GTP-binding protein [Lachnospiraceae bacterium]|jgi:G3E family GTPase|nr:GTP-binding protein [Lachnospiraceae bacterium]
MTKIDIVSGFLGAGKTTLIKKLLKEALQNTQVVLIENEFGEIGIDGGFLKEAGIEIKEMNSGCICCSLVGDFAASLKEVLSTYSPERVLIEPSGVGKLSDVMKAVQGAMQNEEVVLNSAVVVVDAGKCKMYMKNFGEFFINQIEYAGTIILSRTGKMSEEKVSACVAMLREHNAKATIITTPWDELEGKDILETIEGAKDLEAELMKEVMARKDEHHHHHNHHEHGHDGDEHGQECCHHHEHDGEEHEHCHHHEHDGEEHEHCHHHEHDGEEHEHCHHHEHDGEEHEHECCHHHEHDGDGHGHEHCHHDHDGHHHADEIFTSWGIETPLSYTQSEIEERLQKLEREEEYGIVLRAKGMVPSGDGAWIYFDYVPEECDIRSGKPDVTGKICVIGSKLNEEKLAALFHK